MKIKGSRFGITTGKTLRRSPYVADSSDMFNLPVIKQAVAEIESQWQNITVKY